MPQFYLAIWVLVVPTALVAGWQLSRRMRLMGQASRYRLTAGLLAADAVWMIHMLTGWSLALPIGAVLSNCVFFFFYLVSVFALWSCFSRGAAGGRGREDSSSPLRVISRILSGFLILPLLPVLLLSGSAGSLSLILAVGNPSYRALGQGRISPTVTYSMETDVALFGGAEFPAYKLYRNPRWMPLIRKKAANGALQCPPELAHFRASSDAMIVELTCAGQFISKIGLE